MMASRDILLPTGSHHPHTHRNFYMQQRQFCCHFLSSFKDLIRMRRNRRCGITFILLAAVIFLGLLTLHRIATKTLKRSLTSLNNAFEELNYVDEDEMLFSSRRTLISTPPSTTTKPPHCLIPVLQPNMPLNVKEIEPISCKKYPKNPVYSLKGRLFVEPTLEGNNKEIRCTYKPITFKTDFKVDVGLEIELANGSHPCPAETMFVSCSLAEDDKKIVFESTLRCLYQKKDVMSRISKVLSTALISLDGKPKQTVFKEKLNILMFGFDSVSHVNWLEQLPKTTSFFLQQLGATIFDGYNIVGDGTTAAILGLTTGYMEEELHESRRGFSGATQIDDFPFIWRQLADEAGYATLWDEEQFGCGTFHYRLMGFKWPPVDYYGRPFRMFSEVHPRRDDNCYGSMTHFDEQVSLFDRFFENYPDPLNKFGLVFSSIYSHTHAEQGGQAVVRLDNNLLEAMKRHLDNGFYNNSVLILFSDHGSRYSGSRATQRGKIAERLPFFGIAFPEWFRKKYPVEMKNLQEVSKKLTTPFDLHATLLDIGRLEPKPGTPPRGISFFKPHPPDRTCSDAGISPHWCTCLLQDSSNEISVNGSLVKKCLSTFERIVNEDLLGDFINKTNQCEPISVVETFSASRFTLRNEVTTFVKTVDGHGRQPSFDGGKNTAINKEEFIQVSFTTQPGNGQWEATFSHDVKSDDVTLNVKQISRTNLYGDAPKCIQESHPFLRPFCFCKTTPK